MGALVLLYFLALLVPLIISECDVGGTWSTWMLTPDQGGFDYCGSCWRAKFSRECRSEPDCPCEGQAEFIGEMNTGVCSSPRTACCPGYEEVDGICQTVTSFPVDTPPPNATYCPPSGVGIWGTWSEWEACSASCGQFGTKKRTRICLSEAYGCSCYESDVGPCQTLPCPENLCPDKPECSGAIVTSFDVFCYPFGDNPSIGSDAEPSVQLPSELPTESSATSATDSATNLTTEVTTEFTTGSSTDVSIGNTSESATESTSAETFSESSMATTTELSTESSTASAADSTTDLTTDAITESSTDTFIGNTSESTTESTSVETFSESSLASATELSTDASTESPTGTVSETTTEIVYLTYDKCPLSRVPPMHLDLFPPNVTDARIGIGATNETFVTCEVEEGRGAMYASITQSTFGGEKVAYAGYTDQSQVEKFKCDTSPMDQTWGELEFFCFSVPYYADENIREDIRQATTNWLYDVYIPLP